LIDGFNNSRINKLAKIFDQWSVSLIVLGVVLTFVWGILLIWLLLRMMQLL